MPRQVISAMRVLPPFEIIDYPKTIDIKMKTPAGIEMAVSVDIMLLDSEETYLKESKDAMEAVNNSILMAKADTMRLATPEQITALNKGEIKLEDIDKIEEEEVDEFALKMSLKTLAMDVVE